MKHETFEDMRGIYSDYRDGKISLEKFEKELSKFPKKFLVEFIADAISRGWISSFNMGVRE